MSRLNRWIKAAEPDRTLDAFRDGIGELSQGGEFAGYLASAVGEFWSPSSPLRMQWCVWLVAVWPDGTRERSVEDYPPWSYVDEMKQGFIDWDGAAEHRGRYEFRWLPPADADAVREAHVIKPSDF